MDIQRQALTTRLVEELGHGDRAVLDQLLPLVYEELRELAGAALRRQRPGHTLQPTALLNEAVVRLIASGDRRYESPGHLLALAASAMRSVLVDHARRAGAHKRPAADRRVPLSDTIAGYETRGLDLLGLEEAIQGLERADPELAQVVELLFFGGLTAAEAGRTLGCSSRTVERHWRTARAFLRASLDGESPLD